MDEMVEVMSLIRVGVIGCGFMGRHHARVYSELLGVKLLATADVLEEKAKEAAREFGAEKWYTDYHELLARSDIDAVSIVVPDHLHRDPTVAAAKAGKAVLLEKPIATTMEDADAIIGAVKRAGIPFLVGHILRFDYRYAEAKKRVEDGSIGDPVSIWARRNNAVTSPKRYPWLEKTSPLLFLGVHDIDAMRWIIGSDVERVYAEAESRIFKTLGVEDAVWALLKFKGGTVGALETVWILPATMPLSLDSKFELIGTKGSLWISYPGNEFSFCSESGQETFLHYWPVVHGRLKGYLRDEIVHFINCVEGKEEPLVSAEDARAAVETALAMHRSLKEGKPVGLPL